MDISIDTEDLKAALQGDEYLEQAKKIVKYHAADLGEKSMRKVRVVTGHLKRSAWTTIASGGLEATVGYYAEYAGYVEYGTRYMDARPYMRPAWNQVKPAFKQDFARLNKLIKGPSIV